MLTLALKNFKKFKTKRRFREIEQTWQVVRNDIKNEEQRKLALRIANKRKLKEILHVSKGSGRKLKCEENPMLVPLLEYVFMEADIRELGGGGVHSHPRLLDVTLFKGTLSRSDMRYRYSLPDYLKTDGGHDGFDGELKYVHAFCYRS